MGADGKVIRVVLTIGLSRSAIILLMVVAEVRPDFAWLYVGEYRHCLYCEERSVVALGIILYPTIEECLPPPSGVSQVLRINIQTLVETPTANSQ